MADKKYGVAVVGFGGMGSQHVKLLNNFDRMGIVGIYDTKTERKAFAEESNIKVYHSLEETLAAEEVDIVLIATPNDVHKDIAIQSLEAGKHVICEKPVTLDSTELNEILEVEKRTGNLFVVSQNRRWDEDYLSIKKMYDENTLGEVFNIESRVHGSRGIPGDWRKEKDKGGGMMLDWGVHLVDRMLLLIDEKVTSVYSKFTYIHSKDVDDGFKLFLEFESGKTALIEVGTYNFINLPLWYMTGTKGTAVIEDWSMKSEVTTVSKSSVKEAVPIEAGAGLTKTMAPRADDETVHHSVVPRIETDFKEFYANVADTIEGKAEILIKNDEVMRVMKLMEAAFESSEKNEVIPFETPALNY